MLGAVAIALTVILAVATMGPSAAGAQAPKPLDIQPFITAAYIDFLGRAPADPEFALQATALQNGTENQADVVNGLANSPEWVSTIIQRFYRDTLGRPADPGGLDYWSNEILSGRESVASVAANFYSSDEYYNNAGASIRPWLTDLYHKVLLREPDQQGLDYWTVVTVSNGRYSVAAQFFQSSESRNTRVNNLYLQLLGRPGDPGGIAYWSERILSEGDITLAVFLAASDEYSARAQARFPVDTLVIRPKDPSLIGRVLTPDVADRYSLTLAGTTVAAGAPASNTSGNTRIAFVSSSGPTLTDEQSCATWSSQTAGHDQQGAILRLTTTPEGFTKGITVTKNILFGGTWIFNVHVWDTSNAQVFTQIASFNLSTVFGDGNTSPLPWTLCARVVDNVVSFIVWPDNQPQPAWDNPNYGGSVSLPDGWNHPGIPGWYIGHLTANDQTPFDNLTAGAVPIAPSPQNRSQTPTPATPPRAPTAIPSAP